MEYVGIDGCKGGWFAVCLDEKQIHWSFHETFAHIFDVYKEAQRFFVDIPIGLPPSGIRGADTDARHTLPTHLKSSIFNTPVRDAVYAATKQDSKSINEKLTGKSLTEQSLGLMKKILEVDSFLQKNRELWTKVFESYPEIDFIQLAGKNTHFRKKDFLGGLERFRIIEEFVPKLEAILTDIRKKYSATKVASDDIMDAFILALTAKECKGSPKFFPNGMKTPPKDATGLPMAIWFI